MQPLSLEEVARLAGGRVVGAAHGNRVCGVSIDSRRVRPGDLFVALPGARVDGHDFIPDALQAGAAAVLAASDRLERLPAGAPAVAVPDSLVGLQALARAARDRMAARVVGVTGSNGKTSTKDLIYHVLSEAGPVYRTVGNQNTEIGLPLALLAVEPEAWAVVLEMGMRARGEIALLAKLARPEIGVVTNVGPVHLETLGSVENIARAKAELIEALPPTGTAVLNADDPRVAAMRAHTRARVVDYGIEQPAAVRAVALESDGLTGSRFTLAFDGAQVAVSLPVPGRHQVLNALAAAAVGLTLGLAPEAIAAGLGRASLSGMRWQTENWRGALLINDAYNAGPASMRAALATLAEAKAARRIAVLGDMLELGPEAPRYHREVGAYTAGRADLVVAVGRFGAELAAGARAAGVPAEHLADPAAAGRRLRDLLQATDAVLFKASRGVGLERAIGALKGSDEEGASHG
ncbi:MAG TPA: UDP-N-acetylmuramoyl-tripeptide--D-alanyl-D-alanine ligase [Limnochordia bacterium]|nr:UDP-N-acetylmuramoyl-tripeptide--D-alanyl-D-alanine ligase [Limnochordia bacterium]